MILLATVFIVHWCYCAMLDLGVSTNSCWTSNAQMLLCRGVLIDFEFWGGKQNFVPDMWQVVFSHISV